MKPQRERWPHSQLNQRESHQKKVLNVEPRTARHKDRAMFFVEATSTPEFWLVVVPELPVLDEAGALAEPVPCDATFRPELVGDKEVGGMVEVSVLPL